MDIVYLFVIILFGVLSAHLIAGIDSLDGKS